MADSNDPGDLSAGAELPGAYTIEAPLLQGRTRVIYSARSQDGTRVAVHLLDPGLDDGLGEWFLQGARGREEVEIQGLPRTMESGRLDDGRPFEVTELLEGTSMREALDTSPEGLDPLAVVHVVNEVAAVLDALHQRKPPVIHRTICPEHMVVLRDTHEVRLLGLFYADRPQFESVRPGYRSPEELAGVTSLGPRADVFSLATVAYELLTGRMAWQHVPELALDNMRVGVRDRVSVLKPTLPTALDAVFERAWSLSPDTRHSSAGSFARALRKAIDPLDLATAMASNVFDDRPTAQVPELSSRLRNNTLLNAGAVAQAIVPRAMVGVPRASGDDATASRPPPPRKLRAPAPPGTRPVRENEPETTPKIAVPRPEEILGPPEEPEDEEPRKTPDGAALMTAETPASTALLTPETTAPNNVAALVDPPTSDTDFDRALPAPTALSSVAPPSMEAETPAATVQPPDEPTPLATSAVVAEPEAPPVAPEPKVEQPQSPPVQPSYRQNFHDLPPLDEPTPLPNAPSSFLPVPFTPVVPAAPAYAAPVQPPPAPPAEVVAAPPAQQFVAPAAPVEPPVEPRPHAYDQRMLAAEPTVVLNTPRPEPVPWVRSPVALAGLFIAHAILVVGIAHAIAYAMVQRQAPSVITVPAPAPVCAPCAACAASSVPTPPPPLAPQAPGSPAVRVVRPVRPAPAARPPVIRQRELIQSF